jgi:hypothetical protein
MFQYLLIGSNVFDVLMIATAAKMIKHAYIV